MGTRSITEVMTDLNIATADFIIGIKSAINNDNFFNSRMMKKSKPASGGAQIEVDLRYGRENTKTMSEYQEYDLQPREVLDLARFDWRHVNGDMVLSELKVDVQNTGKPRLIELAKIRSQNMAESMSNQFSTLLFQSVAAIGADDPDSLIKICATSANSVGGLDGSNANYDGGATAKFDWNPKILDYTGSPPTYANLIDPTSIYYIEKLFRRILGPLTIGRDHPSVCLVTQGLWDAYEEVLRADKRWDGKAMTADGGFQVLKFRTMLIAVDSHVPGGKMNAVSAGNAMFLTLNEKYLGYVHSPNINMRWTKWKRAERQPVYFSLLDWYGAVICSRRDRQGAVLGLPTDATIYA